MKAARFRHTVALWLRKTSTARAKYLRDKHVFHHVGKNVMYMPRTCPLYAELISLHDNVIVASNVSFLTHDFTHHMLNRRGGGKKYAERVGCIEVMDNVFIGAGTRIIYNVRIGSDVIIAAGSIVTHDLEPNGVYAGAPARRIRSLDEYIEKISVLEDYPPELRPRGQTVSPELADFLWERFNASRKEENDD